MRLAARDPRPARPRPGRLRGPERGDPPHRARHPAHRGRRLHGLGYGYGYAFAQDNLCEMAETYVTVNGERSRYFGPDAATRSRGNGATPTTSTRTSSSSGSRTTGSSRSCSTQPPPRGPAARDPRGRARLRRPATTRYLRETGVDDIPDPRCRGKAWVRPITELDAYRRFYQLALLASSGVAIDGIARRAAADAGAGPDAARRCRRRRRCSARCRTGCRSATSAPTPSRSARRRPSNGKGHAARQPALPLGRAERFYQAQLTIPGKIDVGRRVAVRRAARPDRPHATTWPGATRSRPRSASRRSS